MIAPWELRFTSVYVASACFISLAILNRSTNTFRRINLSYTGELWRNNPNQQVLQFGYVIDPWDFEPGMSEVIWAYGQYHMFLTFVPGIFNDWNHVVLTVTAGQASADGGAASTGMVDVSLNGSQTTLPGVTTTPNDMAEAFVNVGLKQLSAPDAVVDYDNVLIDRLVGSSAK